MIRADEIAFATTRQFRRIGEAHYRLTDELHGVELNADRLWRDRHELWGELSVYCGIKGAMTIDGAPFAREFQFLEHASARAPCRSAPGASQHCPMPTGGPPRTNSAFGSETLSVRDSLSVVSENTSARQPRMCTMFAGLTILKRHPQMFWTAGVLRAISDFIGGLLAGQGVRVLYATGNCRAKTIETASSACSARDMPDSSSGTIDASGR